MGMGWRVLIGGGGEDKKRARRGRKNPIDRTQGKKRSGHDLTSIQKKEIPLDVNQSQEQQQQ